MAQPASQGSKGATVIALALQVIDEWVSFFFHQSLLN
jgi:hypothetical protein